MLQYFQAVIRRSIVVAANCNIDINVGQAIEALLSVLGVAVTGRRAQPRGDPLVQCRLDGLPDRFRGIVYWYNYVHIDGNFHPISCDL